MTYSASRYDQEPEAIAWARAKVQAEIERAEQSAADLIAVGDPASDHWAFLARHMRRWLLGDTTSPVMGRFDERLPKLHATVDDASPRPYRMSADRARALAALARRRVTDPESMRTLADIARHFSTAADILAAFQPHTTEHGMPSVVGAELEIADSLAGDAPSTRFFSEFTHYVTQPVTGRSLPFPDPLNPIADSRTARERELCYRLEQLHNDTRAAAENPAVWLTDVFTVWDDWMTLADEVNDEYKNAYPYP
ncbi:hypothetical protein ACH4Y0_02415 [Streptomyces sp. NPDC020707]|uniref:hypothetical protein n=1 Tax=Streptomyces sp. NPDC020707 TaxID=3365084 RepID=UPI0037983783